MESIKRVIVPNRGVYPRVHGDKIVGYTISIPSSFSGMLDPQKRYTITLEVEE